ncbi:MAG: TadE/TadG family type IV pilus assembly protein [Sneathiella sp.]
MRREICSAFRYVKGFRHAENGSVMVELAFALPILVLLLFGGFDAGRYLQLIQRADQAAMASVDALIDDPEFSSEDLLNTLAMAKRNLAFGGEEPDVKISITSYILSPEGASEVYFDQSEGTVPVSCNALDPAPHYTAAFVDPAAPHQYYFRVKLCVVAPDTFFLSNFLPLKNKPISAVSFGHGKQWSNIPVSL